jgi:hypothetical protein
MRLVLLAVALLAVPGAGCATGSRGTSDRADLEGVYRTTGGGARWTLALAGRRFAVTRRDGRGCAWMYGGATRRGARLELRTVDAGGTASAPAAQPADDLALRWNLYRDVPELHALSPGAATLPAGRAWRQVTGAAPDAWRARGCSVPATVLRPTGVEDVRPSGAMLSFSGEFVRTAATRWEGSGASADLGAGRMTIDGPVELGDHTRSRVTFKLRVSAGVLRGCAIASIIRRPHRRYVWDGPGQITATSPGLRRYLALSGGIGGVTYTYAPRRMHGGFGSYPGPPPRRRLPDIVC